MIKRLNGEVTVGKGKMNLELDGVKGLVILG